MKIKMFDLKKYRESLRRLEVRGAPEHVVEAYKDGYSDVVNMYYQIKLQRKLGRTLHENTGVSKKSLQKLKNSELRFVQEAFTKRDEDFLKAFFVMTNLNIVSGERLPPNAGKLLKQGIATPFGLKKLFKKLR